MDAAALRLRSQMESAVRHLREQAWGWRPLRPFEDASNDCPEDSAADLAEDRAEDRAEPWGQVRSHGGRGEG
jgi:hypothetical protein